MVRNDVAGAAVVDSNEIVAAASRVGIDAAVQQDDRSAGLHERSHNFFVQFILRRGEFKRREENSGDATFDVLSAKPSSAKFFSLLARAGGSPEQSVAFVIAGLRHALTDRFEDLGQAQIRNEKPENVRLVRFP